MTSAVKKVTHELRNNCISTYNILTMYLHYFTFVLFINLYEKVKSPAPSSSLVDLAGSCLSLLPAWRGQEFSLRRTNEGKSPGDFGFTLIYWTQGWIGPVTLLKIWSCYLFHKNKPNFLSLFGNITCGRHSALDIAILSENKMFFRWSA